LVTLEEKHAQEEEVKRNQESGVFVIKLIVVTHLGNSSGRSVAICVKHIDLVFKRGARLYKLEQ
jgi:hypothetical protein